jgi:flagellar basal-body rod protein FlgF
MSGIIESAAAILSASERRLETAANNVSNLSTPGYKRQASFVDMLVWGTASGAPSAAARPATRTHADMAQGRMSETGNPLDLAIGGTGFFRVRSGDEILYSRQGQFRRAEDGKVVTPQGHVLQAAGGGDLIIASSEVEIGRDGQVLDGGRPVGRIAIYAPVEGQAVEPLAGSLFAISGEGAEEVAVPQLHQNMTEASNVSLGDEMVTMMQALRQAESGAKLVQLYDELVGRAITTFGQGGR